VKIDRERANSYGLSLSQAAGYLRMALLGIEATALRLAGDEIPVVVRLDEQSREDPRLFETFLLQTPQGRPIPLGNITEVTTQLGPLSIEHEEKERVVKVEADLRGRSLGGAIKDVRRSLAEIMMPRDVRIEIGGTAEQFQESFQTLFLALIVGIVLVYAVMAAQFESFLDPFIIMFAIPFAVTGVFLAFFITRQPLSIMGYVGLIMLTGIVVNNAIVLVDYTNILRRRGKNLMEAVLDAGRRRLRPVLMTTFTTVFGLLPLAISRAEGAELWSPLGISVIGGLLFSTMVTLILVPVLYTIFERKAKKKVEM
jgi:HAE1 family hydrophobic/amphiphilic exporter-1